MTRVLRWLRYQREFGRLISAHIDTGYRVSTSAERRYREQARAAAGYPRAPLPGWVPARRRSLMPRWTHRLPHLTGPRYGR